MSRARNLSPTQRTEAYSPRRRREASSANLADTVNAIRTAGAAPYQLAYAGAPSVAAPTLNAGGGRTSVVIHSAPVFHVGNDAQAQDIEEMLRRHDEELLDEIDERERQRQDDERRRNYD